MNDNVNPASEPESNAGTGPDGAAALAEQAPATPVEHAAPMAEAAAAPPAFAQPAQPAGVTTVALPAPAQPRRRTWIPVVGALAAGAVFGAAAGAGTALLVTRSTGTTTSVVAAAPQTITVNDTTDVDAVTAVAAEAMDSVVTISVTDSGVGTGTGSGVVLDDEGHIVTNTHVVTLGGQTANPTITVTTSSGHVYSATLVGTDPLLDLAVIQVTGATDLQPIEFADSSDLNVGDLTVAIGAPLGLSGTVTSGIISALDRSIQVQSSAAPEEGEGSTDSGDSNGGGFRFDIPGVTQQQTQGYIQLPVIQTDTAINPGNSGGALLDEQGRLIGINVAIAGDTGGNVGIGFAIPSNTVQRVASELIQNGAATHGLLGVTVVDAAGSDAGIVGASVQTVVSGGGAAAAGIQVDDIIVSADGVPITSRNDLTAQIRTHAVGDVVEIVYVRGAQTHTAEVTLGDLNDLQQ